MIVFTLILANGDEENKKSNIKMPFFGKFLVSLDNVGKSANKYMD